MRRSASLALTAGLLLTAAGCDNVIIGNDQDIGNSETYISRSGDKEIHFTLREKDFASAPAWDPSQPLPLPLATVQEIGTSELKKYAKPAEGWRVTEIALSRLHVAASGKQVWIYRVAFDHPGTDGHINLPITLQGKPVAGEFKPLDKSRYR